MVHSPRHNAHIMVDWLFVVCLSCLPFDHLGSWVQLAHPVVSMLLGTSFRVTNPVLM